MRNVYLTFILVIGVFFQLNAIPTITWTGAVDTDWNNPLNWSTGTVPGPTDDVLLSGGTIDLSTATTVQSVDITSGADLTITGTGVLNIAGDTGLCGNQGAIDLGTSSGTVTNNGAINISNGAGDGIYVTNNGATFTNNGSININTVGDDGIFISNGSNFNNSGDIVITGTDSDGIDVRGTFTNTATGTIDISNLTGGNDGILLDDNNGVSGNFVNDGSIAIDTGDDDSGIELTDGGTFTNNGPLTITGGDNGIYIRNNGLFKNGANGDLDIVATGDDSINVAAGTTFDNCGDVLITGAGTGTGNSTSNSDHGMLLNGTFTNSGNYKDIGAESDGIRIIGGTLTNSGALTFDDYGGDAIENDSSGGTITHSGGVLNIGCAGTITELELKCDQDLGTACINFDIFGTAGANTTGGNDVIDNFSGSDCSNSAIDISAATAKINWGTFVPVPGDCFTIVDGSGGVTGLFAAISSAFAVTQISQNSATEIEICVEATLAVELTNLAVVKTERGAKLSWETATEENNNGFDVERSVDGQSWTKLTFVRGNGDSNVSNRYDYLDTKPVDGTNYYRLKQIDLDDKFVYSQTVSLDFKNEITATTAISAYPNPVNDMLFIEVDQDAENVEIQLFDYSGKLLYSSNSTINQIPFGAYDAGIYILKVSIDSDQIIQKIIK